jgi:ABC-type multidrug transport system fused ATPase/permease subunit
VILSLFLDTSNGATPMPTVFFATDMIRFGSYALCCVLFIMETSRNIRHWMVTRLFWILSFISGCFKQTQLIREMTDSTLNVFDYSAYLYQVVFVCNLFLAVLGILGFCFAKYMEIFDDPDLFILKKKAKKDRIRIRPRDIALLIWYGWYLLIPGIIFACVQGYSVIEIAERASDVITASQEGKEAVDAVKIYFYIWIPVGFVCTIAQMICLGVGGEIILSKIRNRLFESLSKQDMGFFSDVGTGYLISRLTTDTDIMGLALTVQLSQLMPPLVELIVGIIKLFNATWRLSLLMNLLLLVTFVLTTVRSQLITQRYAAKYSDTKAISTRKATECIFGYSIVRTFGTDYSERKKYAKLVSATTKIGSIREFLEGIFEGLEQCLNNLIIAIGLFFGASLVLNKNIASGELSVFALVGITTIRAFLQVVRVAPEFYKASGSAARVLDLVYRKPRYDIDSGDEIPDDEFKGHIEFKNVTFAYDKYNEHGDLIKENVLTNYSLDIPAGTSCALVGASGSGKSTVLSLALRFYDVDDGEVLVDGRNIKSLKPRWLLGQMGVVSQMPTLFNGTIEENVKYSCLNPEDFANEEEFWRAVDLANAKAVIESHTEREKFIVGEQGGNLSGGQRQRISIARCIRKNPKLLVFDEVTSALDPESEAHVMVGLKNLMKGKTCLIVAHRLHTIIDCDKIVVMQKGRIIEQGRHQELMEKKGSYFELFSKQQVLSQMQHVEGIPSLVPDPGLQNNVEQLVTALQAHDCFNDLQIKELVQKLSKQTGLQQKEEKLLAISEEPQRNILTELVFGDGFADAEDENTSRWISDDSLSNKKKKKKGDLSNLSQPLLSMDTLQEMQNQPPPPENMQ